MLTAHLYLVVESTHHIEELCAVLVALWFGQRRRRYLLVGVGSALDVEACLKIRMIAMEAEDIRRRTIRLA